MFLAKSGQKLKETIMGMKMFKLLVHVMDSQHTPENVIFYRESEMGREKWDA